MNTTIRRIHELVYRYPNRDIVNRDVKWRNKCKLCCLIDPKQYGILEQYAVRSNQPTEDDSPSSLQLPRIDDRLSGGSWILNSINSPPNMTMSGRLYRIERSIWRNSKFKIYTRAAAILRQMVSSTTPNGILFNLLESLRWLVREAEDISQHHEPIGADLMFPILVAVLIRAEIPNIHLILHFLNYHADFDGSNMGEASYYFTCLQAAVAFVARAQIPSSTQAEYEQAIGFYSTSNPNGLEIESIDSATDKASGFANDIEIIQTDVKQDLANCLLKLPSRDSDDMTTLLPSKSDDNDDKAMVKLSEWVRDQNTMEETISILQEEGWMV
jgi:hypothetical protein